MSLLVEINYDRWAAVSFGTPSHEKSLAVIQTKGHFNPVMSESVPVYI